jgi:hypothetical protein
MNKRDEALLMMSTSFKERESLREQTTRRLHEIKWFDFNKRLDSLNSKILKLDAEIEKRQFVINTLKQAL